MSGDTAQSLGCRLWRPSLWAVAMILAELPALKRHPHLYRHRTTRFRRGKAVADLRAHGALPYTIVMVSGGSDVPGLNFIAPYAVTSIAEHFMEEGRDVLVVYDDLT